MPHRFWERPKRESGTLDPEINLGMKPKSRLLAFCGKRNRDIFLLQAVAEVKVINHSRQAGERLRNENRALLGDYG